MKKLQIKLKRRILKWLLSGDNINAGLTISHNSFTGGGSLSADNIRVGFMVLNTWDMPEGYSVTITRTPQIDKV